MDKKFLEPEVTVVRLGNNDVICTSGCGTGSNETSVIGISIPGILGFH